MLENNAKELSSFFGILTIAGIAALWLAWLGKFDVKNPEVLLYTSGPWWRLWLPRKVIQELRDKGESDRQARLHLYSLTYGTIYAKIHRPALRFGRIALPVGIVGMMVMGPFVESSTTDKPDSCQLGVPRELTSESCSSH